jgi:predicted TIM-barrel fold metal-dependent hydrolase
MNDIEPVFDAHMHYSQAHLDEILLSFEDGGIKGGINLWGGDLQFGVNYKGPFDEMLRIVKRRRLDTFVQFYWPVWANYLKEGPKFVEDLCREMKRLADLGCKGIKVWKDFGMYFLRADGKPATVDEPGLEPIWRTAAELGWTVAMHLGDPACCWQPDSAFMPRAGLTREQIFEQRDRVIVAHPEIRFMLCHACNNIQSIARFDEYLDSHSNVNSDLSADWESFGTQEELWAFLTKHALRLYEGSDLIMPENRSPDRPWNMKFIWQPHQEKLANWAKHVGREVLQRITWSNAQRDFLDK